MNDLLQILNDRKKELALLQPMRADDAERLWEKFRLEWNYNSNHIEGNTLTYLETKALLIRELLPTGNHPAREVDEMRAHDMAVQMVREWALDPERELLEADIRDLNRIILVKPFWKEAMTPDGQPVRRLIKIGEYKEFPNHVQLPNGDLFKYAEPNEVPQKMGDLMGWYRQASHGNHPAMVAARLHYDFVRIHPFDDGNGRVSRLLMNYHLLRHGFQPVIIKSEDKRHYFAALQRADVGDVEAFMRYIAEQMLWSLDLGIRAAKGESVEEVGDWEKELALLERTIPKEISVKEISNDLVYERIIDTVWPLFTLIAEKTASFDKFFNKAEKIIYFIVQGDPKECVLDDFKDVVDSFFDEGKLAKIKTIELSLNWKGYLENPIPLNQLWVTLKLSFDTYQYTIEILPTNEKMVQKNHTVPLTEKEQGNLKESIGKYLVEKMKSFEKKTLK